MAAVHVPRPAGSPSQDLSVELGAGLSPSRLNQHGEVALAWLLHRPGVTAPIVGASKPHYLDDVLAAAELTLDKAELKALEEPYRPHPVLGHG